MTNKVLDIWAVQSIKDELEIALSNIKHDDVIVFENTLINLKIDKQLVTNIMFCSAIYSEESDVLILLMKNSPATLKDALTYLDNKGFNYHLISFQEKEVFLSKKKHKEIWFARDPYVVRDACDDSLSKNVSRKYSFNKNTEAELQFGYLDRNDIIYGFDRTIYFKGKINLQDKTILVVNDNPKKINAKQEEMEKILISKGFKNENSYNFELN